MINVRKRLVRLVGAILDWRTTAENKVRKEESMPLRFPCQYAYHNRPLVQNGSLVRRTLGDGSIVLSVRHNGIEQTVDGSGHGLPDPYNNDLPRSMQIDWWSSDTYERHDN